MSRYGDDEVYEGEDGYEAFADTKDMAQEASPFASAG